MKDCLAVILFVAFLLSPGSAFSKSKTFTPAVADDLLLLRPGDDAAVLCDLLRDGDKQSVRLEGRVTKRRALGKSLVFLDIVPMELPDIPTHGDKIRKKAVDMASARPIQAIMRRDVWSNSDGKDAKTPSFDVYQKIIQPGVHLQMTGHAGPSRNSKEAILLALSAKYTLCNSNPQHLRNVLQYAKEGALDADEVFDALPFVSKKELAEAMNSGEKSAEVAKELLSRSPRNYLCSPSELMGSSNAQKVKLLPPAPPEYLTAPPFADQGDAKENSIVSVATILRKQKERNIAFSGWVQNRRRYLERITVLELVDEFSPFAAMPSDATDDTPTRSKDDKETNLWSKRIYGVLHPKVLRVSHFKVGPVPATNSTELSEMYGNILCSGAQVMLEGYLSVESSEFVSVWITSCRLLQSSWRPSAVRLVLDLLHEGKFAPREASGAFKRGLPLALAENISKANTSATERQWLSAELTRSLQGEKSRVGKITREMKQSLVIFSAVRKQYPVIQLAVSCEAYGVAPTANDGTTSLLQSHDNRRRTYREGSFWQRAKEPQLNFMVEQISSVLQSHPEYGLRKLKVVDIGGGKGLLSNLLAETFVLDKLDSSLQSLKDDAVEVKVVDISRSAIKNGMAMAQRRGLHNIQYSAQDAVSLDIAGADLVVALHACGTLSDVALGHAVSQGCGFVVCPCCFRSNPHLRVKIPSAADENGKLVPVEQWLGVEQALYEPLKQLAELQGDIDMASKAMHTICGLRAMAVDRLWQNSRWRGTELKTSIKAFPIGLSTRNIVLVGSFTNEQAESSRAK